VLAEGCIYCPAEDATTVTDWRQGIENDVTWISAIAGCAVENLIAG
jgi:hypothetical protein